MKIGTPPKILAVFNKHLFNENSMAYFSPDLSNESIPRLHNGTIWIHEAFSYFFSIRIYILEPVPSFPDEPTVISKVPVSCMD